MTAPDAASGLTPVRALGLMLRQVTQRGQDGARSLLDEYRDYGSLHVQLDHDENAFAKIEIVVTPASKPNWWEE